MDPKRLKSEAKSSTIDDLPSEMIDAILVRLPIRDAVRTSILSRRWRYKWTTMTQLEFPEGCALHVSRAVNHVLMLHFGPIYKFIITASLETTSSDPDQQTVDRWMIVLWRNNIKELVLSFFDWNESLYTVHSCVFSCQGLTHLNLYGCVLKLPPTFQGFANLVSLHVEDCQDFEDGIQSVISMCPILQELVLSNIIGMDFIEINCPRLKFLSLHGYQSYDFNLVSAPVLSEACIHLESPIKIRHSTQIGICNSSKIFACANSIEKLELQGYCSELLAFGSKPEKLSFSFEHLKYLCLSIDFCEKQSISFLLSLLRSSYYLEELKLEGRHDCVDMSEDEKSLEINEDIEVFNHLKIVKFRDFEFIEPEMVFIKFLLVHAPVLQKMEIRPGLYGYRQELSTKLMELMQFQRASSQAEIICIH